MYRPLFKLSRSLWRWSAVLLVAMGCTAMSLARADQVSVTDGRAVRAVVEAQLKALAADQGVQAFSYASPSIRQQFGDAGIFMDMVRHNYPMLLHPASMSFMVPEVAAATSATTINQGVQFRDQGGNLWRATYQLERQPDRSWRISGCAVEPDDSSTT